MNGRPGEVILRAFHFHDETTRDSNQLTSVGYFRHKIKQAQLRACFYSTETVSTG